MNRRTKGIIFIGIMAMIAAVFLLMATFADIDGLQNPETEYYDDLRDWKWESSEEIGDLTFIMPLEGGTDRTIIYEIEYTSVVTQNQDFTFNIAHFLFLHVKSGSYVYGLRGTVNFSLTVTVGETEQTLTGIRYDESEIYQTRPIYRFFLGNTENLDSFPRSFSVVMDYQLRSDRFNESFEYSGEPSLIRTTEDRLVFWVLYSTAFIIFVIWAGISTGSNRSKENNRKYRLPAGNISTEIRYTRPAVEKPPRKEKPAVRKYTLYLEQSVDRWRSPKKLARWLSYSQTTDLDMEANLKYNLEKLPDRDFEDFILFISEKIRPGAQGKYSQPTLTYRRSLMNVVNKNTNTLPVSRIRAVQAVMPQLNRLYFGPYLTKVVYNPKTPRKKQIALQTGAVLPKMETIIDAALFFDTTVNKLLGVCYSTLQWNHYWKKPYFHKASILTRIEQERTLLMSGKIAPNQTILPEMDESILENIKKRDAKIFKSSSREYENPYYAHTLITQPNGKKRLISRPYLFVKRLQRQILQEILNMVDMPEYVTGFTRGRSVVDNARIHLEAQTMVKLDLRNFFPTIKYSQVCHVFRSLGYNRPVSGLLACICTDYYNSRFRFLPQGAPTSPMIANLYALPLDNRLNALWQNAHFRYSRYADDLTFSTVEPGNIKVGKLIQSTYKIIKDERLQPNFQKTKIYRKGHRKEVTGIIVNEKLNLNSRWVNAFRDELYRYGKFGFGVMDDEGIRSKVNQLRGKFAYLYMVNPDKAAKYRAQVDQLVNKVENRKGEEK